MSNENALTNIKSIVRYVLSEQVLLKKEQSYLDASKAIENWIVHIKKWDMTTDFENLAGDSTAIKPDKILEARDQIVRVLKEPNYILPIHFEIQAFLRAIKEIQLNEGITSANIATSQELLDMLSSLLRILKKHPSSPQKSINCIIEYLNESSHEINNLLSGLKKYKGYLCYHPSFLSIEIRNNPCANEKNVKLGRYETSWFYENLSMIIRAYTDNNDRHARIIASTIIFSNTTLFPEEYQLKYSNMLTRKKQFIDDNTISCYWYLFQKTMADYTGNQCLSEYISAITPNYKEVIANTSDYLYVHCGHLEDYQKEIIGEIEQVRKDALYFSSELNQSMPTITKFLKKNNKIKK